MKLKLTLCAALLLLMSAAAMAETVVQFGTFEDDVTKGRWSQAYYAATQDQNWTYNFADDVKVADRTALAYTEIDSVVNPQNSAWAEREGLEGAIKAQWIGDADSAGPGYHFFKYAVDNLDLATVASFSASADNRLVALFVNGIDVTEVFGIQGAPYSGNEYAAFNDYNLSTGYDSLAAYLEGSANNTTTEFVFVVLNTEQSNADSPVGLNVEFSGQIKSETPTTPEPATLAILGLGVLGAGLVRRRNRK